MDKVLNHLICTTIQSGFFTGAVRSFFALGALLSSRLVPGTSMISLFAMPIGRVYTHTMMDHLIRHEQLRNILAHGENPTSFPIFVGAVQDTSGGMMFMGTRLS
ncbi:hypothetical protein B0H17DRAFT_1200434 [Mycena rosella]|uniref:Uncharacterized protein n=1 Tax=Mycena rosella TaxID=1033263 RepID=A0AAD7DIM9_MYCRO|nr:hypothetical protein B0H17DRAFT_1200434 [Mycena rosella]